MSDPTIGRPKTQNPSDLNIIFELKNSGARSIIRIIRIILLLACFHPGAPEKLMIKFATNSSIFKYLHVYVLTTIYKTIYLKPKDNNATITPLVKSYPYMTRRLSLW